MDALQSAFSEDIDNKELLEMDDYPMHCYSLNRTAPLLAMFEYRLPCSLHDALKFLGLYLNVKSLMLPAELDMAYAILAGPFFVRKVSTSEVVRHIFNHRYPVPAENRWFHLFRRLTAFIPATLYLERLERAVPETIIEVFATSNGILLKGPLSETAEHGMSLASVHFWSQNDAFTYAGIFLGWHEQLFPFDVGIMLHRLLKDYVHNLSNLFDPVGGVKLLRSYVKPTIDLEQMPSDPSPAASPENPTDRKGSLQISSGREERHRIFSPSRFYPKSVAKISQMVASRQRNIDNEGKIEALGDVLKRFRASSNTIRKLPELHANWNNPNYRWYVDTWLREQTRHTPDEISQILSDLCEQLTDEDWDLVISRPGETPAKLISKNGASPVKSHS